jgi:Na+-translocating ferredoxin:NAD+ oxidoreductase RNF subunit RnfB
MVVSELITYSIAPDLSNGCTLCALDCSVDAISGERKQVHTINNETCYRCGVYYDMCTNNAIVVP